MYCGSCTKRNAMSGTQARREEWTRSACLLERLAKMLRTLTTTSPTRASSVLPHPNLTPTFSVPFTRQSLAAIRTALIRDDHAPIAVDPKEKHAAVLIPLCNVDDRPGILLELRGKLRMHSGEVRYATRRSLMRKELFITINIHIAVFQGEGWTRYVTDP